jgi:hypothetical protein
MAKQEVALPMSCYIVRHVTTRSMLYLEPVSHAGYSNAQRGRIWRSSMFPWSFQSVHVAVHRLFVYGIVITKWRVVQRCVRGDLNLRVIGEEVSRKVYSDVHVFQRVFFL